MKNTITSSYLLLSIRLTSPSLQHSIITCHLLPLQHVLCCKLLSHMDVEKEWVTHGCLGKAQITEPVPHRRQWLSGFLVAVLCLAETGARASHRSKHPPTFFLTSPDLTWKSKSAPATYLVLFSSPTFALKVGEYLPRVLKILWFSISNVCS